MLTDRGTEVRTGEEAARMGLSRYKVGAGLADSDMDRAREFYEGKLDLSVGTDLGDNLRYQRGEGTAVGG